MNSHEDLSEVIDFIDPSELDYGDWVGVGMALKEAGLPCEVWDRWSARDAARYREGECERKWAGFGSYEGKRLSSGSIVRMAEQRGFTQGGGDEAIEWDGLVPNRIADPAWLEPQDIRPLDMAPARMLSTYLKSLFDPEEYFDYVLDTSTGEDSRARPVSGGCWTRTAGEVEAELERYGDISTALGSYDQQSGAYIRINPLDGDGVGNKNVIEYRFALVESDSMPKDRQLAVVRALELPCAAIVDSGNKSVHAIVRIDAGRDFALYRKRVEQLYSVLKSRGYVPDEQNKNPSRLSRLPGAMRAGKMQALLSGPCGKASWEEWAEWWAEQNDDLPQDTNADWDDPIELDPPLIGTEERGILRQGQKMVLAGPSKAGKSFALIDLAEAIACGGEWLGYPCAMGPVYYVNLEIADQSFRARQHAVWADRERLGQTGAGLDAVKGNFYRLDLRGHAAELSRLAPSITRRILKRGPAGFFKAVIIDPIYKVNGGDENDARAISAFTNQLDRIARECGCAVIYAHHFAKGPMGQRRSMDRMSGSGVFARDADSILSLTQLEVPEGAQADLDGCTAWRLEATLREFKSPEPIDLLFRFPRLMPDASGRLSALEVEGADPLRKVNKERKERSAKKHDEVNELLRVHLEKLAADGIEPTRANVLTSINEGRDDGDCVSRSTLERWTAREPWCAYKVECRGGSYILVDKFADSVEGLPDSA